MSEVRTLSARYGLERDQRIAWTSANWDRFARENGAPELVGRSVVGHSLWEYIEGSETREFYATMLQRVRATGDVVTVPFRCDSPGVRRFMELRMARPAEGQVEIVAELLREETRPAVDLLDNDRPRAGAPILICSFCKKVESRGAGWLEVEDAQAELRIEAGQPLPPLAHAVCPQCKAEARKEQID